MVRVDPIVVVNFNVILLRWSHKSALQADKCVNGGCERVVGLTGGISHLITGLNDLKQRPPPPGGIAIRSQAAETWSTAVWTGQRVEIVLGSTWPRRLEFFLPAGGQVLAIMFASCWSDAGVEYYSVGGGGSCIP